MAGIDAFAIEGGVVDLAGRRVVRGGAKARLTALEARLLGALARIAPETAARGDLLREVWGYGPQVRTEALEQAVRRVRVKIEADPRQPRTLLTEHGVGYRLVLAPPRRALPAERDGFVGRAAELAALAQWVASDPRRLITIQGVGGMGKTRLALAFARRWSGERAGGGPGGGGRVAFVDLSAARTRTAAIGGVLDALGAYPPDESDEAALARRAAEALRALGDALVVIDNVEQVLEDFAALAAGWLDEAPALRLVVTSRERLRIRGERLLVLDPLAIEDAVALWEQRAVGTIGGEEDRDAVAAISRRLDGIPLAIELAAARGNMYTPAELLASLDDGLAAIEVPRRGAPARAATLAGCLRWSWDLLGAAERRVLAHSAIFRGGFTLASLAAVASDPADPVPLAHRVQHLVDKSMVRVVRGQTGTRFDLFAVVRSFAEAALGSARRQAADRHLAHFSGLGSDAARRAARSDPRHATRLLQEIDNLAAAADHALASGPALRAVAPVAGIAAALARNKPAVALGWVRRVLGAGPLPGRRAVEIGLWEAELLVALARTGEAAVRLDALTAAADEWPALRGRLRLARGNAHLLEDEREAAARCYAGAIVDLEAAGDLEALAGAVDHAALAEAWLGRFDAAQRGHAAALRLHEAVGTRAGAAVTAMHLAAAAHRDGDGDRAGELYRRAATAAASFHDRDTESVALAALAGVLVHRDRLDEARDAARRALALALALDSAPLEAGAAAAIGEVCLHRGDLAGAAEALARAERAAQRSGRPFWRGRVCGLRGELALRSADLIAARRELARAEEVFRAHDQRLALTMILCRRGRLAIAASDRDEAVRLLREAERTHDARGEPRHPAVLYEIGRLRCAIGAISRAGGPDPARRARASSRVA